MPANLPAPGRVRALPRPKVTPLAPDRFGIQFTIDQATRDKLQRAQELASHAIRPGDLAHLFDAALDVLIAKLERRKFGAAKRPRTPKVDEGNSKRTGRRHIPDAIKREVWERDGGQCTFVSESGQRCPSREQIEFDHIDPVELGGETTVAGMRLLCRTHNQYMAECELGAGFIAETRAAAQEFRESTRGSGAARTVPPAAGSSITAAAS